MPTDVHHFEIGAPAPPKLEISILAGRTANSARLGSRSEAIRAADERRSH
jgi:hypothetical protein